MRNNQHNKEVLFFFLAVQVVMLFGRFGDAFAITTPAAGSFAYDIYDIGVNSILKGPIGFVAGVGAIIFGAIEAIRGQVLGAVPAILGGAALLKADGIVQTLGCLI
jgi:hypothetical protein